MRRFPAVVRLLAICLLTLIPAVASAAVGDVYVRGTATGVVVRVPDADLADCELLRPTPERLVLVVRGLELRTQAIAERLELVRSMKVLGPEVLGGLESRVLVELVFSGMEA